MTVVYIYQISIHIIHNTATGWHTLRLSPCSFASPSFDGFALVNISFYLLSQYMLFYCLCQRFWANFLRQSPFSYALSCLKQVTVEIPQKHCREMIYSSFNQKQPKTPKNLRRQEAATSVSAKYITKFQRLQSYRRGRSLRSSDFLGVFAFLR